MRGIEHRRRGNGKDADRGAVLLIYLMTLCFGLSALPLRDASLTETFIVLLQSSCFIAVILLLMFSGHRPEGNS